MTVGCSAWPYSVWAVAGMRRTTELSVSATTTSPEGLKAMPSGSARPAENASVLA